jgi:rhodanese-related sulfurtransferase
MSQPRRPLVPIALENKSSQYLLVAGALLLLFIFAQSQSTASHFAIRTVTVAEAKRMIDDGAVVVDVRGPQSYGERHLPGAISVPLSSLHEAIPAALSQAIAKPVVVYCGDGVTVGPEGTDILNKAGFTKAVNMERGIEGWADAGLPLIKPAG